MADIIMSPLAERDMAETAEYIAAQLGSPAALRLVRRIREKIDRLRTLPLPGASLAFRDKSLPYRYLVCGHCLIFYHTEKDVVYIDRIFYGRRDYLSILFRDELEDQTE